MVLLVGTFRDSDFSKEGYEITKSNLFEIGLDLLADTVDLNFDLEEVAVEGNAAADSAITHGTDEGVPGTIMLVMIDDFDNHELSYILLWQPDDSKYDYTDLFNKIKESITVS